MQKSFQLSLERLFRDDRRFGNFDLRIHGSLAVFFPRVAHTENENILAAVIQGHILPGLEESHFSHPFGGYPARREIGHAPRLELHAHVGNVGFAGEDWKTYRANFFYRRPDDREHDVKIMNHEIKNDVDIERARGKDAEPVNFEKHGLSDERGDSPNRRVEPFEMPDLADTTQALGQANQFVGVGERGGQGLFNQHIDPTLHQDASDLKMAQGGYSHRRGMDFAVRRVHLFNRTEGSTAKFVSDDFGLAHVGIDHPHQADWFTLLGKLLVDAGVITAEGPNTDYGYVDEVAKRWRSWELFQQSDLAGMVKLMLHDAAEHVIKVMVVLGFAGDLFLQA